MTDPAPPGEPAMPESSVPSRFMRRLPLLALAMVALLAGLWTGLQRLGLDIPVLRTDLAGLHGPVFVLGFLGTQIGLERAVALRRGWPFLAPAAAGAGSLWLIAGLPATAGQVLLMIGGLTLCSVYLTLHREAPAWHNGVMGLGAAAWTAGVISWLAGAALVQVMPWLAAFLVLTIVGERLELTRMTQPPAAARAMLPAAVAVFVAGLAGLMVWPETGWRVAGAGLLAQALWLIRFDVARRTVRMHGVTRFMAVALLAGYTWLAVAGVTWLWHGEPLGAGFTYDAMVHTIFVGFVFSMIFAHAPVIVPAVLGVPLPFKPAMYAPLALLHAGLLVRLAGDAAGSGDAMRAGGVVNEIAIVAFVAIAAACSLREQRARRTA